MRLTTPLRTALLLLALVNSACPMLAQPGNELYQKDSVDFDVLFGEKLDSGRHDSKNRTNFVQVFEDPRLLQLSAGMNFLNVLRWQLTDQINSPSFITGNPISPLFLIAIDGVPYNSDMSYFANLNTFDFDRITLLGPANGAVDYGLFGGNGGILLRRKSGRGVAGPHIEFNSFSTRGVDPSVDLQPDPGDRFHWSNSLAYEQDFGVVDTRISFNHTFMQTKGVNSGIQIRSFKLNTGIEPLPGLRATIILERHKRDEIQLEFLQRTRPNGESDFTTAGAELEFRPLRWVTLSTQILQDDLYYENRFDIANDIFRNDQKRKFMKASIQSRHSIGEKIEIAPIVAIQQDNSAFNRAVFGVSEGEETNRSISGGINTTYNRNLTFDFSYRIDNNNFSKTKKARVYAGGVSWNFTQLLGITDIINFGRIRSNFGYRDGKSAHPLTQVFLDLSDILQDQFYSSSSGIDLALLGNKIQISYNHFVIFDERLREASVTEPPFLITYIDFNQDRSIVGHELVVGAYPLGTKEWYTKLTWSRPDPNQLSFLPNWYGNIYLMRDFHGTQLSTSISYEKGGEIVRDGRSYTASNIGLRDISISHKPFFKNSGKFGMREMVISVTGRNLGLFRASGLENLELYSVYNGMYSSFSLNISGKLY